MHFAGQASAYSHLQPTFSFSLTFSGKRNKPSVSSCFEFTFMSVSWFVSGYKCSYSHWSLLNSALDPTFSHSVLLLTFKLEN